MEIKTDSPQAYFPQALTLATNPEVRQYYRQPIQNPIRNHPQASNNREYSQQVGILLTRLYQQTLGKQP